MATLFAGLNSFPSFDACASLYFFLQAVSDALCSYKGTLKLEVTNRQVDK